MNNSKEYSLINNEINSPNAHNEEQHMPYGASEHVVVEQTTTCIVGSNTTMVSPLPEGCMPIYAEGSTPEAVRNRFYTQGYQDVWAMGLFLLQIAATIGAALYNLSNHRDELDSQQPSPFGGSSLIVQISMHYLLTRIGFAAVCGTGLGVVLLLLMRAMPMIYIVCSNVLSAATLFGIAAVCIHDGGLIPGVVFIVLGLLVLAWVFLTSDTRPFSNVVLKHAAVLSTKHYGSFAASFFMLLLYSGYTVVFIVMALPVVKNNELTVYPCIIGFFWTTQVLVNVVHVTASGVMATWFFAGDERMPSSPSLPSLKRALTTSFGSVCLGSLIVALLDTLVATFWILRTIGRHPQLRILLHIAVCCFACIRRLVARFNKYAYSLIAIDGSAFVHSAKKSYALIFLSGERETLKSCVIFMTVSISCFSFSMVIGLLAWRETWQNYDWTAGIVVGSFAFFVSWAAILLVLRPVYAGAATILLCFVEHRAIANLINPEFSAEILMVIGEAKETLGEDDSEF